MKKRIWIGMLSLVLAFSCVFGLVGLSNSTKQVKAYSNLDVDFSSIVYKSANVGGTVISSFDGIAINTKAVDTENGIDLSLPVSTSGNIAIEIKNLTAISASISVTLKKGETLYTLNGESTTYLVKKDDGIVTSNVGNTIPLSATTTSDTNVITPFDGYVIIPNTNSIDKVVISSPLDAGKMLMIGKVYSVGEIGENFVPAASDVLYTPNSTNFEYTNSTNAAVKYVLKNTVTPMASYVSGDSWEQSRLTLPSLEEDGTFDVTKYKYLVADVDFSERTAQTRIGFVFFRDGSNKYNADRLCATKAILVAEDGTISSVTNASFAYYIPAGFKGQIYMSLNSADLTFGDNWKDKTFTTSKVFSQLMIYGNISNNGGNVGVSSPIKLYFTNTDYIQSGDSQYVLSTSVNNEDFGYITLDTTDGITITPVANSDYAVEGLYVDGESVELTEGKYTIASLTKNTSVEAKFVGTKVLTFNNDIERVTITADKETITNGSDVTFNFAIAKHYYISSIKANGEDIVLDANNNYTVKNIQSSITFAVETQLVENTYVESSSYTMINTYAGGTLWAPFDGIAVASLSIEDVANEKVVLSLPVTTNKNVAIRIHNANRDAGTLLKIDLKKGDTVYSMSDESKYYLVKSGIVTEMTGATIALAGTGTAASGYYGFDGYVIIPNTNDIESVEITVDMSAAKKVYFGNIYEVETIGASYVPADTALYTPTKDNYQATFTEGKSYVKYLDKYTYVVIGQYSGSDGWEQSRITLPSLNESGKFDLNNWTYLVFDVDFSGRTSKTRIGYEFFRDGGTCYNADRANAKTVIAIGDDGSYYTESIGLGGGWYIPAGFKGKLYFTCAIDDMNFGANYKTKDGIQHPQLMLYALAQNNLNNIGVESKLQMYFTSETLPNYEYKTITVTVDNDKKGSAKLNTYTQVICGTTAIVTVTPKTGYLIDSVLVNGEACEVVDGKVTITNIQDDVVVYATFKNDPSMPKYAYTINKTDYVEVTCDVDEIAFGTDAEFTFTPAFGYYITSVKVNDVEVTLENNKYIATLVESALTIDVETAVIPALEDDSYSTNIAESEGYQLKAMNVLNNFYSSFDSVLVSSKIYDRELAKAICPQPYVGAKFDFTADFSSKDMIIVQYQHYHTQTASSSGNGIKLALKDVNGNEIAVSSGSKVYLINGELAVDSSIYTNGATYVSGGMIFTTFNFVGYIAIPKASFTDNGPSGTKDAFDWSQVAGMITYNDYRWWSDSGSRYAVGNIYSANFNGTDLKVTAFDKIWDIANGTYSEYLRALDGKGGAYSEAVTYDQFAFTTKLKKGNLYFFDFSPAFDKFYTNDDYVGIKVQLSDDMKAQGYYDFRDVNVIRFNVDNTGNPAIDFNIAITSDDNVWSLLQLAKVVYYNTEDGSAIYGSRKIPAGFKGYVDVYYEASNFTCDTEDAVFPEWIDADISIILPLTSKAGFTSGMNLPFDIQILLDSYTLEYTTIAEVEYSITYELNGGVNDSTNPTTYKYSTNVTLANPTKTGYEFQGWYLNSDFTGTPVTSFVNKSGDLTFYAKWGANFTITYDIGENGDVTPRTQSVEAGSSLTLLVFPDDGYEIATVTVNGQAVALDENDSFTISDIQENKVIKVTFVAEQQEEPTEPDEEEKKSGCGASVLGISGLTFAGLAIVIALKKRREE